MIFRRKRPSKTNIIDWHLTGTRNFMKNKLKILFLSFGILFAACSTASTQKGPVDETSAPSASSENSEVAADDSKFPPAPAALKTADIKLVDGSTFKLDDQKGKVVLFNLWATWCGPCRQEMPDLIELQDKYRDQGFEIVGLNADDESPEEINPFVEKMKLNYKIGWSDEAMMKEFMRISNVAAIPQSFLIDRTGHLRGVFVGGGSAVEKLKESLKAVMSE